MGQTDGRITVSFNAPPRLWWGGIKITSVITISQPNSPEQSGVMWMIGSQMLLLLAAELVPAGCCVLLMPAYNPGMSGFLNTAIRCQPVSKHSKTTHLVFGHSTWF